MDQPAEAGTGKLWECGQCSSTFGRLDHLKRHAATHKTEKNHACHFCAASFSRGDVLRRHWKSCKTRLESGQDIPDGLRGGKHRRACDSCAMIRKACSGDSPCFECNHRGRTCTYQRLNESEHSGQLEGDKDPSTTTHSQNIPSHDGTGEGRSWDLGHQNFYPARELSKIVYARNNYGL